MLDLTAPLFTGGPFAAEGVALSFPVARGDGAASPTIRSGCSSVRTTVVTLRTSRETVFNLLADIENLPRWAPGFCESVSIVGGRWVGLTSCGELYLELEANETAGEIALSAGWNPEALHRLALKVTSDEHGNARVRFPLAGPVSPEQAQIYSRLEVELRELTARVELIERSA